MEGSGECSLGHSLVAWEDHNVWHKTLKVQLSVPTMQSLFNATLCYCLTAFVLIYVQFVFESVVENFKTDGDMYCIAMSP